ncbi:hypothetical protein MG290_11650 [Flavobacterium sp. CBA20B-1]|uniref:hypothetical protein n=1 Tax=unclassified Flavobacterium TaxID=196869 RepID=UPI00222592A0|nr:MULTISPECIES: hypothetical protein [unclassified Flavobacterium]WCM41596.1 hypothetical protein MG290_11650 [Flavobacterium sp. CBA20B-1]
MENNQWFYSNMHKQLLYMQFCEQPEFCKALAYLLTFKEHQNLNVKPHTFSIELSNADIQIFIIHTVFFQQKEYLKFKELKNVHFVSFGKELAEMHEFSEMKNEIKFISKDMLMSTVEALTENNLVRSIQNFKELDV